MKLFRRNKDDDEDDEFDEDFDFDDLDEEVEEAIEHDTGFADSADTAGPVPVPVPVPVPDSESDFEPDSGLEEGLEEDADRSEQPEQIPDDDDLDFGDEFDDDEEDDDLEDESDGRFAALKVKLAPVMVNRWARYGIYGGIAVFILAVIGGGAMLFIGGDDHAGSDPDSLAAVRSGGLLPPSGGGLGEFDEAAGEAIGEARVKAGIQAFDVAGGLNAAVSEDMKGGGIMVQVSSSSAYNRYPDKKLDDSLSKAPNSDLLEFRGETVLPLPRIADDGRTSWQEYARPSDIDLETPRVGVLITGMGLSKSGTLAAIRKLPPEVTLSFSPYAEELDQWMIRSRRAGHEVILGLPLESNRFPIEDHGPMALKVELPVEENMILLEDLLAMLQGSIGVEVIMGSRFTANSAVTRDLLEMLMARGMMIVDNKENPLTKIPVLAGELGMPFVVSEVRLDNVMASTAIRARLKDAERILKSRKQVIVTTTMTPAIMERLQLWFASLHAKGAVLAPVSSFITLGEKEEED